MASKQVESSEFSLKINPKPVPITVADHVETALKEYLKGYKFDHPISIHSVAPNVYELIATNKVAEINLIEPDQTGTNLVSYKELNTKSVLYIGTKGTGVKFLYQWESLGGTWVTSPFFLKGTEEGTNVRCANPIDISDAITGEFPVPAIVAKLNQISSGGGDANNKFDGTDFEWVREGASLQDFTIGALECSGKLYWGKLDGTQCGVKLIGGNGDKLKLKVKAISIY